MFRRTRNTQLGSREIWTRNQNLAFRVPASLVGTEVADLDGAVEMQFPRPSVIIETVSDVGVLLDLT